MYLIVQPQITRDNISEFVKKEICDPCKLELNEIPYWHGKKTKALGKKKGYGLYYEFHIEAFLKSRLFFCNKDFFRNADQACSVSIFKCFSNMQGRRRGEAKRKLFPLQF